MEHLRTQVPLKLVEQRELIRRKITTMAFVFKEGHYTQHTPQASIEAKWAPGNILSPGAKWRFPHRPDAVNPACKNISSKHVFILGTEFRFARWMWHFSPSGVTRLDAPNSSTTICPSGNCSASWFATTSASSVFPMPPSPAHAADRRAAACAEGAGEGGDLRRAPNKIGDRGAELVQGVALGLVVMMLVHLTIVDTDLLPVVVALGGGVCDGVLVACRDWCIGIGGDANARSPLTSCCVPVLTSPWNWPWAPWFGASFCMFCCSSVIVLLQHPVAAHIIAGCGRKRLVSR
jgi:hypothetical protein